MEIRPATQQDLEALREIDGTIESLQYLHLQSSGEGLAKGWALEQRPLREKLIDPNRLDDEAYFIAKQIITGADEGLVLVAEHESAIVATIVAQPHRSNNALHIVDIRIDYDYRRQGLGSALIFQVIQQARQEEVRAVSIETLTNNIPVAALLCKCGFELSGVDTRRRTNHDIVKEAATLFWYAALD